MQFRKAKRADNKNHSEFILQTDIANLQEQHNNVHICTFINLNTSARSNLKREERPMHAIKLKPDSSTKFKLKQSLNSRILLSNWLVRCNEHIAVDEPGEATTDQWSDPVDPVAGKVSSCHSRTKGASWVHGATAEGTGS